MHRRCSPGTMVRIMIWNPWRGCHRKSEGCRFCYIHKGDAKRRINTDLVHKTDKFFLPVERNKNGDYKIKPGRSFTFAFHRIF